jgi:hypothetical protein
MKRKQRIKYFKKCVKKFQRVLGLLNWDIHVIKQDKEETRASAYWHSENRCATICWSKTWIDQQRLKKTEIRKVAFHEALEVLCCDNTEALREHYSEKVVEKIMHNILRTIENIQS